MRLWLASSFVFLASSGVAVADEDARAIAGAVTELKNTIDRKTSSDWWTTILGPIVGAVIALAGVYFKELRDRRKRPVLEGSVEQDKGSVSETPVYTDDESRQLQHHLAIGLPHDIKPSNKAKYVRLIVRNTGILDAKRCRATLVQVQKKSGDNWSDLGFHDTARLKWSYTGEVEQDIVKDTTFYLDLCATDTIRNELALSLTPFPLRYESIINDEGHYRLTVLLNAENADPVKVAVRVNWSKKYDTLTVEPGD